MTAVGHILQQLQGVFDLVRLVDPERAKVLTLHPDGTLEERAGHDLFSHYEKV